MATEIKVKQINGIDLNVLTGTIQAIKKDPELGKCTFRAQNKWIDATRNSTRASDFYGAGAEQKHKQAFEMYADEPPVLAGGDEAANPAEHLLHALASCVTTSLVAHAAVQGIHIDALESELEGDVDLNGFLGLNPDVPKGYQSIRVKIRVKTDARNLEMLKRLSEFSPVWNTITHGAKIDLNIEAG